MPQVVRTPEPPGVNWAAIDARESVGTEGELRVRELLLDRLLLSAAVVEHGSAELGGDESAGLMGHGGRG
jgi:hypothetical protein